MQQLTLPISSNIYHPDEFIVSSSNEVVYDAIKNWERNWGVKPYEFTVLMYGAPASGKTFLTKIWQNSSNAKILENISDFDEIILSQNNAFIIENIENYYNKQETLNHCFNLINECKKHLLFTTASLTNNFTLPDLISRINSILRVEITQLDDELMKILIFKHFSDNSMLISNKLLEFLLGNLPRQFSLVEQLLKKINNFALQHKKSVTIAMIKELLN